eukprot:1741684-Pyramimonas_sp.AAC.1
MSRLSSFHSIPQSLRAVVKAVAASCASDAVLAARKIYLLKEHGSNTRSGMGRHDMESQVRHNIGLSEQSRHATSQ